MRKTILFLLFASQLAYAQLAPLCFLPPSTYTNSAGGNVDISADDFNGDGIMDVAGIDYNAATVVMLLGTPSGSYVSQPCNCAVGANPSQILSGDYDNDGKKDVVVVSRGANQFSVLFGTGTGSFLPQVSYSIGTNSHGMTKNDFNNDGIPDIATSNYSSGNISLLMGQSNGVFVPSGSLTVGTGAEAITSGDYNNDGKKDIAITVWTMPFVRFFYGNGNGTFQPPINCPLYTFDNYAYSIVTADFNNDTYDDVVLHDALSSQLNVLFGTSSNTMSAYVTIGSSFGTSFARISAGDLNADGNIDVVTPKGNIFLSNGTGSFVSVNTYTFSNTMASVIIKTMNNDAKPDLIFSEPLTNSIKVLLNGPIITSTSIPNFICAGHSLTLYTMGANSYTWSTGPVSSSIVVSPTATTNYSVVGSTASGCTNTANLTVSVNINPTAADLAFMTISSPTQATICVGGTVSVCAAGAASYTWSTGSNSACITDTPNATATYTVLAKSTYGCYKTMSYTQNVDACSGLKELHFGDHIILFPNPTSGIIYVDLDSSAEICVRDLLGNVLLKKEDEGKIGIDLANHPGGVYILSLKKDGAVYTEKIVLQK